MKKIVIFGGTGMTGLCALDSAVNRGFEVRAFVRDASKIPEHLRSKVETFVGDVTNSDRVSEAVKGTESVVVVLGTRSNLGPTTVMSDGTRNIIAAMKTHAVQVMSVCLSAFLFYKPNDVPAKYKDVTEDHQRMFDAVKESGLNWIAVLPPLITESPSTGYQIEHDKSPGRTISKYDLGTFLIDALQKPEHYQKVCDITSKQ
ncbi:flavin reductase (NADPH)-like isoform X2 [Venturia canescens]|uniref:flavin reductase (NADPH)-like isoform X2 n=1 Tax=Venturia canescens TaxID=32260 RepID=UPI001C9D01B0|nr:flavin reductase (NADPH)-like isoform X2 [Venturia canescens]